MLKQIKRFLTNKFFQNTSWMVFAQIYQMVISLFIGVISARYLGPSNYGTINYAASYISFFTIFCALGLEGIVVREIISKREQEGIILGSGIIMRLIAGVLSMVAVCIIVYFLNPDDHILLVVTFLQSIILPFNAFNLIDMWYQSNLNSKVSTIIRCISYTVMSLYKVFLLITGKSVEWFAFSTALDSLLIAIMFMIMYRKQGKRKLEFDLQTSKQLLRKSYHLIISTMMAVLYSQMDRVMIGKMMTQTDVGYYTAAATICNMWVFIPQAFANSARPVIMEVQEHNKGLYIKRLKQLSGFIFWIGVLFSIAFTVLADFIILVLYGKAYSMAKEPLVILIWSTVFSSLSYPRSIWMICENKQNYTKHILIWGVIINLVLNYYGIKYFGIIGAAVATLFTEIMTCLIAPTFYKETRVYVRYLIESFIGKGILK